MTIYYISMMTMVHHTIFRHMKKMKTAIGSCSMGKELSKKSSRIMYNYIYMIFAVELSLNNIKLCLYSSGDYNHR